MEKKEIASILEEIALMMDLKGENPFKIRAYLNAARVILTTDNDITQLAEQKNLTSLQGIGSGISEKLTELILTGKMKYYEDLKKSTPPGLLEMLTIPSLGPRKTKVLYEKLKIQTIGELEYACKENRLVDLEGFGQKTQEKILSGIIYIKKTRALHRLDTALFDARMIFNALKDHKHIKRISLAGSIRRMKEIIKDIDVVASSENPAQVMKHFVSLPLVKDIIAHGNTKSTIRLTSGINADLRIVSDKEFPYALHHVTGSKEHNIALRSRAQKMNIKMNEYGIFKNNKRIPCKDEEELFEKLKLQYIPPELRENRGEIEAAEKNALPDLVAMNNIKGILHVHTDMSDAEVSLEKIVEAVRHQGSQYIGIADHSKSAYYAHGLKEPDIKKQHTLIDNLNKKMKNFYIFKGIESDILPDGSLDYPDKVLETFDFVIASVHSKFNMSESDMTTRIIRAMKNKYCTMLGHPTGRLLLARESYPLNQREIIQAAADYGVALELNANPFRLDIDWREIKRAKEKKVLVSINPDAHRIEDLDYMELGVGIARKGWLSKEDVLNTMDLPKIKQFFHKKK